MVRRCILYPSDRESERGTNLLECLKVIHCIVDNYATHSHPKIKAWPAARPRSHMYFIPTYSSWLNQVARSNASAQHTLIPMRRQLGSAMSQLQRVEASVRFVPGRSR